MENNSLEINQTLAGKRVVIIHPGNPRSDFRLKKTVSSLSNAGAHVTVLAYLSAPENDIKDWNCESACLDRPFTLQKASTNNIWILRVLWNLTILKVQLFLEGKVDPCAGLAKRAQQHNPDLVYCIGIESVEEAHKLLKKTNLPIIYESYEYFPSLLKGNLYFDKPSKNKKCRSLEKSLLRNNRVTGIVVGEEIARGYKAHYKCREPKVVHNVAPNFVGKLDPHCGPVRFYFQSYLRPTYNIEKLITSFAELHSDATLTIQGNSLDVGYLNQLQALITNVGASDKVFLKPACPYEQVVDEASHFDVGLISLTADRQSGFDESVYLALPNKLFTYASAGLAVLASNYPAQARLAHQYECGLTFEPEDTDSFLRAVKFCVDNRDSVEVMRANALKLAKDYSLDNEAKQLVAICERALSGEFAEPR